MRLLNPGTLFLAALTVLPASAAAQTGAADRPEIVVQADPDRERQIRNFIDALTPAQVRGQLSRYEWEVCPAAVGIPDSQKALVVERLRQVAGEAGIDVAKADCDPNVLVIVTGDKRAFLERLQKQRGDLFPASWSRDRIRRLVRDPAPAAAWHFETMVRPDGREFATDFPSGVSYQKTMRSPSRITPGARPKLVGSIVVVDFKALDGLTTIQLADYAAMRAFARTDPARLAGSAAPTILKILDAPIGTAVPLTLTDWDIAFLKGLYASPKDAYAAGQRSEIRRRAAEELQAPQTRTR